MGELYLIHFDRPFGHARHYAGWALDAQTRIAKHRRSRGANLLKHVNAAGIGWQTVKVWPGTRTDERKLKNQGGLSRHCPACRATGNYHR